MGQVEAVKAGVYRWRVGEREHVAPSPLVQLRDFHLSTAAETTLQEGCRYVGVTYGQRGGTF